MSEDKVFGTLLDIQKGIGRLDGKVEGMGREIGEMKAQIDTCKYEKRLVDIEGDVKDNGSDIEKIQKDEIGRDATKKGKVDVWKLLWTVLLGIAAIAAIF